MGAYKGHFRIICAVCERLQRGRKGSDTVVGVCDDCRTLSHIEVKQTATEAGRAIADSVNGIWSTREGISPLKAVPNHSAFWKQNRFENAFELLCWASTRGELCDKVSAL